MSGGHDPSHLFTLHVRVRKGEPVIVIHAYDGPRGTFSATGHSRIDVEVRQGGRVVFPRGALYCGVPSNTTTDGIAARELVLSLVSMRPGDTDEEYFGDYTEEQLSWVNRYAEELSMVREMRYCDPETGAVRS